MFNKAQIMNRAWEIVKSNPNWKKMGVQFWLRRALQTAWDEAKNLILRANETAKDRVRASITLLDNKNHWVRGDYVRADMLQAELRAA